MSRTKRLLDVIADVRSLADSLQAVAEALLENDPLEGASPATAAAEPILAKLEAAAKIKLEDVRAVLADKSRSGHTAAVRELLTQYGAARLSEIDPGKYPALLNDAEMLG